MEERIRSSAYGRPKPRVDRAARQATYIRVAAETFREMGLSASMQDVADRAGVAKILIYREFPSRKALLEALFEEVLGEIRDVWDQPWTGWGGGMIELHRRAQQNRAGYLLLLRDSRSHPETVGWWDIYKARQVEPFARFLTPSEGAPEGADVRARQAALSLVGMLTETLISWIEDEDGLNEEQRREWFGHMVREWRRITRRVYRLDPPE